ncbi:MAG: hypothetical protein ACOX83_10475 [Candidatus Spyradocola sp.]
MLHSVAKWICENPWTVFVLAWLVGEMGIVGIPMCFRHSTH